MEKQEILEKSRQENSRIDEMEENVYQKSASYGMIGMSVVFLILLIVKFFIKGDTYFDILAMYFSFLTVGCIYRLKKINNITNIVAVVCNVFITICWLVLYIWRG